MSPIIALPLSKGSMKDFSLRVIPANARRTTPQNRTLATYQWSGVAQVCATALCVARALHPSNGEKVCAGFLCFRLCFWGEHEVKRLEGLHGAHCYLALLGRRGGDNFSWVLGLRTSVAPGLKILASWTVDAVIGIVRERERESRHPRW